MKNTVILDKVERGIIEKLKHILPQENIYTALTSTDEVLPILTQSTAITWNEAFCNFRNDQGDLVREKAEIRKMIELLIPDNIVVTARAIVCLPEPTQMPELTLLVQKMKILTFTKQIIPVSVNFAIKNLMLAVWSGATFGGISGKALIKFQYHTNFA